MKSTDESGIEKILRGNITEVAKTLLLLLSSAEVSKRWDSLLLKYGGILLERNTLVDLEIRTVLAKHKVWSRAKATCTMHMCEMAMSHRSFHQDGS